MGTDRNSKAGRDERRAEFGRRKRGQPALLSEPTPLSESLKQARVYLLMF